MGYHPRAVVISRRVRKDEALAWWLAREAARLERRRRAVLRLCAYVERRVLRARAEITDLTSS